jgi:glycerol uptake facilitator-like aquaporin
MFDITSKTYFGTVPVGSNGQSLVAEIIISFLLMFVISAVSTDERAVCTRKYLHIKGYMLVGVKQFYTNTQ